jgi:hypothetical protein
MMASLVVLGVFCSLVLAAGNPEVTAINEQIKALKAEEKVTLKTVHAWYEGMIKRDKLTAEVLHEERTALKKQEDALLSVAANDAEKAAIKKQYDGIRALLKEDGKLDAAAIRELRALEKAHETTIANAYKSKIQALEALAKAAAKTPPPNWSSRKRPSAVAGASPTLKA